MRFVKNFTCNDEFSFYQPLVYLSCYRLIIRDGPGKTNSTCSDLCSSINAKTVSFDEWNSLNLSYLQKSCKKETKEIYNDFLPEIAPFGESTLTKETCDFTVPIE